MGKMRKQGKGTPLMLRPSEVVGGFTRKGEAAVIS
jgi:hypothetical protein